MSAWASCITSEASDISQVPFCCPNTDVHTVKGAFTDMNVFEAVKQSVTTIFYFTGGFYGGNRTEKMKNISLVAASISQRARPLT